MKKSEIKKVLLAILGVFIMSVAVNCFTVPSKLMIGGATGVALILYYVTHIPVGTLILLINVPIFVIGIKYTNKKFMIKSLIGMVLLSFMISITKPLSNHIRVDDLLANCLVAGALNGLGIGLVIRYGYSTGGFDIVNIIAKKELGINMATTNMAINGAIVIAGGMISDFKIAIYTVITIIISSLVLNKVIVGLTQNNLVLVVCNNPDGIADKIMKGMGRGVTFLKGVGAYTKEEKNIIYCIVNNRQLVILKNIVNDFDETAFISITRTYEIQGQGFERPVV
ncbi:YitT family protein [Lutibacter sp. B2]|nr:YitT family protein [Lutibacter sp. B2]